MDQQTCDTKRDEFFKRHGFDVMQFAANLPVFDLQAIVEAVYNRVTKLASAAPIPTFPQRGSEYEINT